MLSIVHDFPEIAKSYSIGKSYEGRDINVIELTSGQAASSGPKEKNLLQTSDEEEGGLIA